MMPFGSKEARGTEVSRRGVDHKAETETANAQYAKAYAKDQPAGPRVGSGQPCGRKPSAKEPRNKNTTSVFPNLTAEAASLNDLGLSLLPLPNPGNLLWNPVPSPEAVNCSSVSTTLSLPLSSPHLRHDADAMRRNNGQNQGLQTAMIYHTPERCRE